MTHENSYLLTILFMDKNMFLQKLTQFDIFITIFFITNVVVP